MSPTQLNSHANMVVVRKQVCIIQRSRKIANVRQFSNECPNIENSPLIGEALYNMWTRIWLGTSRKTSSDILGTVWGESFRPKPLESFEEPYKSLGH